MASIKSSVLDNATDREILVTRVFTAPRAKVWLHGSIPGRSPSGGDPRASPPP